MEQISDPKMTDQCQWYGVSIFSQHRAIPWLGSRALHTPRLLRTAERLVMGIGVCVGGWRENVESIFEVCADRGSARYA